MSYQPHYIANFDENGGLDRYYEPFLIPEKAFPELEDAYCWRGRVKRREGFVHLGRLRRVLTAASLGNSAASPWTFGIYATLVPAITGEPNAEIQPGSVVITIAGPIVFTDNGLGGLISVTPGNSGTINYATGVVVLTHTAGIGAATTITFSYYPGLPVMGLPRQELDVINEDPMIAFDTKYSYRFVGGQFERLPSVLAVTWNGTNSEFFWSVNYWRNLNGNILWTTNFHRGAVNDPIRYWDTVTWNNFAPIIRPDFLLTPTKLLQARCIVPYKGRLLMFHTFEGDDTTTVTEFPQRLRWSQNGTPLTIGTVVAGPTWGVVGAWADDVIGYGGYVDAPTQEQIVSVGFIKDILVVKFERSSWRIVYTGNEVLPFVFEKINAELGAESTFSLVQFDKGIFSVGNYGIISDDGLNVERIDMKIPQISFDINNDKSGVYRVHGIRDFSRQMVYWTYPTSKFDPTFPNKILAFNYINNTYAIYNDSFTCFGYYQKPLDITWASLPYLTWEGWTEVWNSGATQSQYPDIAAGNQHGYVALLAQQTFNGVSLTIQNINTAVSPNQFTVPNHNLHDGQFVKITGIIATGLPDLTSLNNVIYLVTRMTDDVLVLQRSDYTYVDFVAGSTYLGGGKLTVLNNISITTKTFSPFYEQSGQARLGYLDFFINRTANGEVTANVLIDEDDSIVVNDPTITTGESGNLGSNILNTRPENIALIPFQANQSKIWHRVYVQANCQNFAIWITMSDPQMFSEAINSSDFVLHALTLYLSKNARLTQ